MKFLIITTGGTIGQEKQNNISVSTDKDHSIDILSSVKAKIPSDCTSKTKSLFNIGHL